MVRKTTVILLAVPCLAGIFAPSVRATAQTGDVLVVDGKEHSIATYPLEPLLDQHPDLRPKSDIISTGLWRGYVAYWTLQDERLLLTDIQARRSKENADTFEIESYSVFESVFPQGGSVFAGWYSGYLIVPQGDRLEYVHMGCASTFEKYTVYSIVAGVQTEAREMSAEQFRKFRKKQFRRYQDTDEYDEVFRGAHDAGDKKADTRDFVFRVMSCEYTARMFDIYP